jgi:hypothetical protein
LAALALAICSRRAAEDLRADGGVPGSADSPVTEVALEGIVPSQEAVDAEFTDPRRGELACKEALLSAGRDGFLNTLLVGGFALAGRIARGLGADIGVGTAVLPGLGLLASAKGGGLDAPARVLGVVLITVPDRFRGVPSMGSNGALKLLAEDLKFGKP